MSAFLDYVKSFGSPTHLTKHLSHTDLAQLLIMAKVELEAHAKEKQDIHKVLDRIEIKVDTRNQGTLAYCEQWKLAHAAFKGAFDTPVDRHKRNAEYADDARERINAFDSILRQAYPEFFKD